MVDEPALWELLRAAAKDDAAWPALMAALEPELVTLAKRAPIGRLHQRDDSRPDIVAKVFERLHARDRAAIKKLVEMDPPPVLRAWLSVVVRRAAIDYMRAAPEYERASPAWVSLATLTSRVPGAKNSLVEKRELVAGTVREMVERATAERAAKGDAAYTQLAQEWNIPRLHVRRLATRGTELIAVLAGILEGYTQTELGERLQLSRREVELNVRSLEELLRARFAVS